MKHSVSMLNIITLLLISVVFCIPTEDGYCAAANRMDPNYSNPASWLALPTSITKDVDVFWIYPTVYTGKEKVASIDDSQMLKGAELTIKTQAAVFKNDANIFAPLYRQANMSVLKLDNLHQDEFLNVGKFDVRMAFNYYLRELNGGRPFIIASHSQGSVIALALMKELMSDPTLRNKMIAAYTIGWGVTQKDLDNFTFLKVCETSDDTGCIITYNTIKDGHQKDAPTILPDTFVVNPLSWTTKPGKISASQNKGSVFFKADGNIAESVPNYCSAEIKNGGLAVETNNESLMPRQPFGQGVYHVYDYSLFFKNLKENIAERIKAYQSIHNH